MKYKELYKELAQTATELGCSVGDHDLLGYCYHTKNIRAFIVINPDMNYKDRFLTLCHELGHLFYMQKGNRFVWSDEPRTEEQANFFAIKLLQYNDVDADEYRKFYNKALRIVKKRKPSWHEL